MRLRHASSFRAYRRPPDAQSRVQGPPRQSVSACERDRLAASPQTIRIFRAHVAKLERKLRQANHRAVAQPARPLPPYLCESLNALAVVVGDMSLTSVPGYRNVSDSIQGQSGKCATKRFPKNDAVAHVTLRRAALWQQPRS